MEFAPIAVMPVQFSGVLSFGCGDRKPAVWLCVLRGNPLRVGVELLEEMRRGDDFLPLRC